MVNRYLHVNVVSLFLYKQLFILIDNDSYIHHTCTKITITDVLTVDS